MDPNNTAILIQDLKSADYQNMTADQAYHWLFDTVSTPNTVTTVTKLQPLVLANLIGVDKAEAVAAAIIGRWPTIGQHIVEDGVDPTDPQAADFLNGLVSANILTAQDITTLMAGVVKTVTTNIVSPSRASIRFIGDYIAQLRQQAGISWSTITYYDVNGELVTINIPVSYYPPHLIPGIPVVDTLVPGQPGQLANPGFPNSISEDDFTAAWGQK